MMTRTWHAPAGTRSSTAGGLLAVVLWSSSVALARSLGEELGARTAVAAVLWAGALTLALRGALTGTRLLDATRYSRRYLLGCGSLFVFYMYALFQSMALAGDRMQVLELGMLNYLWPGLTLLLSVVMGHARANMWLIPGTLMAVAGEFLVLTHQGTFMWATAARHVSRNPGAYALALAAGISWALYSALARRWSGGESRNGVFLFMSAAGFLMLGATIARPEPSCWTLRAAAEVVFLGTTTAFAYSMWDTAMRRGNITVVAAGSYFAPLLSTLVSCVYLDVSPGQRLWVGAVVLVAGSLLSWRAVSPRHRESG